MAKSTTTFYCKECGNESPKWTGKCSYCGAWNTLVEGKKQPTTSKAPNKSSITVQSKEIKPLNKVTADSSYRIKTGMGELDRVLGGGFVQGSVVLLGGDPGIGKSTILLQICNSLAKEGIVLYVSGEESDSQIKMRADRIGPQDDNVLLYTTNDLEDIETAVMNRKPKIVIVDSIQTMYRNEIEAAPGSLTQVREVTASLTYIAKQTNTTMIIVGHVTKDGNVAGPKTLEHIVDTVLYFEGDKYDAFRILRANKNRYGSTNEIGVFEMTNIGFKEIKNPSGLFISETNKDEPGCCVSCIVEGTRPMLVELQALVCDTTFGNPRRMATGVDYNRMTLLSAVLEKKTGLRFGDQDIYLNIVGGFKTSERAADLGIAMAIVSALRNIPLEKDTAFIGEISLTGEIRPVSQIEKRVQECKRMGFKNIVIPNGNAALFKKEKGIIPIATLEEAVKMNQ